MWVSAVLTAVRTQLQCFQVSGMRLVARERPKGLGFKIPSTHNTQRRERAHLLEALYSMGDQWQQVTVTLTCAYALSNVSELIHLVLGHPSILGDTTGKSGALAHQQLPDLILQQCMQDEPNW